MHCFSGHTWARSGPCSFTARSIQEFPSFKTGRVLTASPPGASRPTSCICTRPSTSTSQALSGRRHSLTTRRCPHTSTWISRFWKHNFGTRGWAETQRYGKSDERAAGSVSRRAMLDLNALRTREASSQADRIRDHVGVRHWAEGLPEDWSAPPRAPPPCAPVLVFPRAPPTRVPRAPPHAPVLRKRGEERSCEMGCALPGTSRSRFKGSGVEGSGLMV